MIRRGVYVLFLRFDERIETRAGALGTIELPPGDYCYVGSAMGGIDQSVSRHLSHDKTIRWHIDHLTSVCREMHALEHEGTSISECGLGRMIEEAGGEPAVGGFGCSDCKCQTHLFRVDAEHTERMLLDSGMVFFGVRGQSSG